MDLLLGKPSEIPRGYSPNVLFPVPRVKGRLDRFGSGHLPFTGTDTWNCYEMSWLNDEGVPRQAVLRFEMSALSPCIVESKSLKLYLGGFSFEKISSSEKLIETIVEDLTKCTGSELQNVRLFSPDDESLIPRVSPGVCIDTSSEHRREHSGDEIFHSHLFRSLCPVTAQPDWATVIIRYRGGSISYEKVRSMIHDLREHQGFHEACAEDMFGRLWEDFHPEHLALLACYTRRGGIDINPLRVSDPTYTIPYTRLLRQ